MGVQKPRDLFFQFDRIAQFASRCRVLKKLSLNICGKIAPLCDNTTSQAS